MYQLIWGHIALYYACLIRNAGLKRKGDFQAIHIAAAVERVFTRQSVRRAINGGSLRKIQGSTQLDGLSAQRRIRLGEKVED